MGEAVNSKKLLTKSYMTWRVVQAPGVWSSVYRERIKRMGNYRSAIIFPEQLLGLNQNSIWSAAGSQSGKTLTASISRHSLFKLYSAATRANSFNRIEDVYDFESKYHDEAALKLLLLTTDVDSFYKLNFSELGLLFTNKNDAAKWCSKFIEANAGEV